MKKVLVCSLVIFLCIFSGIAEIESADIESISHRYTPIEAFLTFTNDNPVFVLTSWVVTTLGTIIGLLTGIDSIISKFRDRKIEKAKHLFFERVQQEWEGKFTTAQIEELKREYKRLEKQVKYDIPQIAKNVALENQLYELRDSISVQYKLYLSKKEKLKSTIEIEDLDKSISNAIKGEFVSSQQKRENKFLALIIILLVLIASPILAEIVYSIAYLFDIYIPMGNVFPYIIAVCICAYILYKFFPSKYSTWVKQRRKKSVGLSIVFLILWGVILFLSTANPFKMSIVGEIILAGISILPFSAGIATISYLF